MNVVVSHSVILKSPVRRYAREVKARQVRVTTKSHSSIVVSKHVDTFY